MDNKLTRDYAVVGVHEDNIFLEANEWDATVGRYYVVTLYLNPEEAAALAERISLCATGVLGGER